MVNLHSFNLTILHQCERSLVRPVFDVGIKIRNGKEVIEATMITTAATWMKVTHTKATFTAPRWSAHPPILIVIPELHELECLDGSTCMAAELYIVPKIPRTTRKLRPYISISRQIDNLLPKPEIPFSSHPAYLDKHLHIHDNSETLDTDAT